MALTSKQRIKILTDRLFPQHQKDIDQEALALLITALSQGKWVELQKALLTNNRGQVGAIIITLFNEEATRLADIEATASWQDNTLSEPEFDRAFE